MRPRLRPLTEFPPDEDERPPWPEGSKRLEYTLLFDPAMKQADRLRLLQRQIAWHARFALTVVEDLEDAARSGDISAGCYLLQALAAACLTISHYLWPAGRLLTDQLAVTSAFDLRESLEVREDSALAGQNLAPLGITVHYTQQDCSHFFDLQHLTVEVDGEPYPLRPVIDELRSLWERAAAKADKLPAVE
jgi:hypothetical protein